MTYPKGVNTVPRNYSHTEKHFIYCVLAFIGNARQFIQYIKSYLSTKILFFKNFLSFYFILFLKKKSKIFCCSQLTVTCYCYYYYSQLTQMPLLVTIQSVLLQYNTLSWSQYNRRLAMQFTYCITKLQYTLLPTVIHLQVTIHLCIAIQPLPSLLLLQYKFQPTAPPYCNTKTPSLEIQTQGCNTNFFFFTIQLGSSPNPFLLHFLSIIFFFSFFSSSFFFLLSCWKITKKNTYIHFFSHTYYWKNTQKHKYTFFFSFLPAIGRYTKKIYLLFFFHFLEYSNKFIKIYFIQFSSILQLVKH